MEKPMVATNSPTATKDIQSPAASAAGPHFCCDAAAPRTIGSSGSTQGDRIDSTPATNDSATPPAVIG
jgi:hypothetical protein